MRSYLQFMIEKVTTSPIVSSPLPSAWRFPQILPCMVIFPSIIRLARPTKKRENMPKTLPPACWRPPWESNLIRKLDWDEREQIFKMSGKIVRTTNITQSAVGNKDGLWTTVFAAAVFINDDNLSIDTAKSVAVAAQGSPQEEVLEDKRSTVN